MILKVRLVLLKVLINNWHNIQLCSGFDLCLSSMFNNIASDQVKYDFCYSVDLI